MGNQKLTVGDPSLESMDLVHSDSPYNVLGCHENVNSHYSILTLNGMADAVALWKSMMRLGSHIHLRSSALELDRWYRILPSAKEEEHGDSDRSEGNASK